MSFQGDVAGIGLGELLQSLARGGKDGVLKLYGSDLAAHLGVEHGLLFLLESPEEREEELTQRCEAAWILDPDPTLAAHRRAQIARADRMETVFSMLEAPNLHFRFEPGPLPMPRGFRARRAAAGGSGDSAPWGKGRGVEALLLEHARIADESSGLDRPSRYAVPRRVDGGYEPPECQGFLAQCDGQSTVLEISDRLGWPLRQAQGLVLDLMRAGLLRLATPQELLALAQLELEMGRERRAAERVLGWMQLTPPGPLYQPDAELLVAAWESGQLGDAMQRMPAGRARELVRKLDLLGGDLLDQLDRWEDLAQYHPQDAIARFKRASLRVAALSEGHAVEGGAGELAMECLRIARSFTDAGQTARAQVTLLLAATTQPETPQTRTELGARLIEVGRPDEGAAWMIDAAQSLIDAGDADKAVQVLGALLKGVPDHREAQALLLRTRSRMTRSRKRRKHGLVAAAGLVSLGLVAVVQVHSQRDRDRKFDLVTAALADPTEALRRLDEHFPEDDSDRISALRATLQQRQKDRDRVTRKEWEDEYDGIAREIATADPLASLEAIVTLRRPPQLDSGLKVEWGSKSALLERLYLRLRGRADEFAALPPEADAAALEREAAWITSVDTVARRCEELGEEPYKGLVVRLDALHAEALATRVAREEALRDQRRREREQRQDQLLGKAQFEKASGQFEKAGATFAELLADDPDGSLADLLREEVDEAERGLAALRAARELADAGEHAQAIERLEEAELDPTQFPLRWRVVSQPAGAQVVLDGGERRTAPFVLETAVGDRLVLEFELDGCERRRFELDGPADLVVRMFRRAERTWPSDFRVEAAPVPVGADHVVADRQGRIERVRPDGQVRWSVTLDTLAGVARTPQFLPGRPGQLLVLAEDGQAWLCSAEDGSLEGPIDLGAPVLVGPYPISTGLAATFENGTYAIWDDELDPVVRPTTSRGALDIDRASPYDEGIANLVVLRAGRGLPNELDSPWTDWSVELGEQHYTVRRGGNAPTEFTVRRAGQWAFVAWEMPSSLVPAGRLWVSDSEGLRSFLPQAPTTQTGTAGGAGPGSRTDAESAAGPSPEAVGPVADGDDEQD